MQTVGIIGAGAWGTALAQVIRAAGRDVTLWARETELVSYMKTNHENNKFLPGIKIDPAINVTESISEVTACDVLLMVVPAQYLRSTLQTMKPSLRKDQPILICSKGIEIESGLLMTQVAEQEIPNQPIGVLTGPTFAAEIAKGLPSAMTLAYKDTSKGQEIIEALSSRNLRLYQTKDLIGAQLGGTIKNVVAIACGAVHGLGLGENARAALMTRGIAEIGRLASAMGAKKETLMGMCGFGDLVLTCSSMQSRNFSLGAHLGEGRTLNEIMAERSAVTEGVHTSKALMVMAKNHAIEMPIAEAVYKCLNEGAPIRDMVNKMLERPLRREVAA
ncbi:MAG: glycerol-3-phosphate acyltransferase [Alphaproteobacteria bacterium]|nr:glycerol-3-phosphate acyltransferase [Alphaproteobacteria bacterium]